MYCEMKEVKRNRGNKLVEGEKTMLFDYH